jgi:uncharacterized membrane protein
VKLRAKSGRRGTILVLAAVVLALGACAFTLSLDASQQFLKWKAARSRSEAAAMAAALALDGTELGEARAKKAALSFDATGGAIAIAASGDGVRSRWASAWQHEVAEPGTVSEFMFAAPDTDANNFGLVQGKRYRFEGEAEVGRVIAVRVHSGLPKELPLTWVAGRVVASADGHSEIEYLGGYLRGAQHAAAQPHGYFEVALGFPEGK